MNLLNEEVMIVSDNPRGGEDIDIVSPDFLADRFLVSCHIPYARLQAIARRVDWPSEVETDHLAACQECSGKVRKMRESTTGI